MSKVIQKREKVKRLRKKQKSQKRKKKRNQKLNHKKKNQKKKNQQKKNQKKKNLKKKQRRRKLKNKRTKQEENNSLPIHTNLDSIGMHSWFKIVFLSMYRDRKILLDHSSKTNVDIGIISQL